MAVKTERERERVTVLIRGYWHQRAEERHGNPPPR